MYALGTFCISKLQKKDVILRLKRAVVAIRDED